MIKKIKQNLTVALLFSTLLSGCFFDKKMSPEDIKALETLKSELNRIESDLSTLADDGSIRNSGLIGTLKAHRLEVLKLNKELFVQRIAGIESGAEFTIKPIISAIDQELVDKIDEDLKLAENKLKNAKAEAARYTGGLVYALKQANVATQENSITMLEYRKSLAKYGLFVNDLGSTANSENSLSTKTEQSEPSIISQLPASEGPLI